MIWSKDNDTVAARMVDTPRFLDLRFGLYSPKYQKYENKWYAIGKPYKIATRNEKKIWNFPKFVRFLGHFLKKQCFGKMGVTGIKQLPRPSKLVHFWGTSMGKPSWKFHSKMLTGFRNTKLWSGKFFFNAIFLMKLYSFNEFWL